MIKAIFFDFDDTLADRHQYAYDCYRDLLMPYMQDLSPIEIESILQQVMLWDQGGDVKKEYIQKMLQEQYGIILDFVLNDVWDTLLWKYVKPFEKSFETLQLLKKKCILGLITNGPSDGQRNKLRQSGLSVFFDEDLIIVSGDHGVKKPDRKLFAIACEKAGVKAEECLFVGDMFHRDILGAINSGMQAVWITQENKKCVYPIKRITHIEELLQICGS